MCKIGLPQLPKMSNMHNVFEEVSRVFDIATLHQNIHKTSPWLRSVRHGPCCKCGGDLKKPAIVMGTGQGVWLEAANRWKSVLNLPFLIGRQLDYQ